MHVHAWFGDGHLREYWSWMCMQAVFEQGGGASAGNEKIMEQRGKSCSHDSWHIFSFLHLLMDGMNGPTEWRRLWSCCSTWCGGTYRKKTSSRPLNKSSCGLQTWTRFFLHPFFFCTFPLLLSSVTSQSLISHTKFKINIIHTTYT